MHNYKVTIIYEARGAQHIFQRQFSDVENVREAINDGLRELRHHDPAVMAAGVMFAPRRLSAMRVRV